MFERFLGGLIGGAAFGVTCYAANELLARGTRAETIQHLKEHNALMRERIAKAAEEIKNAV